MNRLLLSFLLTTLAACGESAPPAPAPAPAPATAPLPPPAQPEAPAGAAIPPRFHGEWTRDPADCGRSSETRLRISADRVRFHESSGAVQSVTVHSDQEITVTAELTGEGTTFRNQRRWQLSPDAGTLRDVTEGAGLVRQRCP